MEQSYEILECGTKAKSLNPVMFINSKAAYSTEEDFIIAECRFKKAEDSRVTYEIDFGTEYFVGMRLPNGLLAECLYTPGQIVKGQIINGKLRIK